MKTGTEIAKLLPEKESVETGTCFLVRDDYVLSLIDAGNYVINWRPVVVNHGGYQAVFMVSGDALRLGVPGDSFRVSLSTCATQRAADALGATMMTSKLLDEAWRQADIQVYPPVLIGPDAKVPTGVGGLTSLSRMLLHHGRVEERAAELAAKFGAPMSGLLIGNVGKHWVNSTALVGHPRAHTGKPAGVNYGWYGGPSKPATNISIGVYQGEGTSHDIFYADYSQTARFVKREVQVFGLGGGGISVDPGAGKLVDIYDLAKDPELWPLVSHSGKVDMRHWAVPEGGATVTSWKGPPSTKVPPLTKPPVVEPPPVQPPAEQPPAEQPPAVASAGDTGSGWTLVAATGFVAGLIGARQLGRMSR